ncbi:MAG TPA: S8 family serine peptidase, partial [Candidatus Krumholzibacteriaceae bacterium]|nr:S8 family serine peptidase [Candidatus Krumholzibacteriaceae bacterium]
MDFNTLQNKTSPGQWGSSSNEFVIGVSEAWQSYGKVEQFALAENVKIVNKILMRNRIEAVVVNIPQNSVISFMRDVKNTGLSTYVEPRVTYQAFMVPNDPYWSMQWGPAKIQADYAWNITTGSKSVLVAVIDTGIAYNHPDLAANYVPLGYDWVNNDPDPVDDNGHGTHVAGIIAAEINNGIGIAGLAQVSIMAEKGLDAYGSGYDDVLAQAIIHATDQNASIINMSWGGSSPSTVIEDA